MKLDNYEFLNAYKGILKAEDDITQLQKQRIIEIEKKISASENQILHVQRNLVEKDEDRAIKKKEFEDKINQLVEDLQYLNKGKNLSIKNITNADKRIAELNTTLESYQFQKFELTKQRNNIKSNISELEDKLRKFPDYEKLLKELEDLKNDSESVKQEKEKLSAQQQPLGPLDQIRSVMKGESNFKERFDEEEEQIPLSNIAPAPKPKEEVKSKRIIDKDEDKKRIEKLKNFSKVNEETLIEERDSEYYGSAISINPFPYGNKDKNEERNATYEENGKEEHRRRTDQNEDNNSDSGKIKDKNCVIF